MLKEILKEKGISQSELAKAIDLSPQAVNLIVNGKKKADEKDLVKIADYLNVSVSDLSEVPAEDKEGGEDQAGADSQETAKEAGFPIRIKSISKNRLIILHLRLAPGEIIEISKELYNHKLVKRCIELRLIEVVGS